MKKKILLCLDGSAYGESCCRYAAWLATSLDAEVDALHVSELWQYETPLIADFGGSLGAQPYLGLISQVREIENAKAAALKGAVEDIFSQNGLSGEPRFHHRTGSLVDIVEEFEKSDSPPNFIVIGKRGENAGAAKDHLGPNMERVVRAGGVPVFVANREFARPRRALLAYDGSPSAVKALAKMIESKALLGIDKHVVTVARPGEESLAAQRLAEAEKALSGHGLVSAQALAGHPGEAIAGYVAANGVDLLLMGAYGHSALRRFIIGSITADILRECRIPILLFR